MSWKEQLDELRTQIDDIDADLAPLFRKRMETAGKIAAIKLEQNLAVQDTGREDQVVKNALERVDEGIKGETALFMRTVMSLSREYQHRLLYSERGVGLPPAVSPATGGVSCAYQGVPGAWSQQAARFLYPEADHRAVPHFEDVFTAVKSGEARYGVVPIENSKTGAIGETYDLLRKYGCYIVGRVWVPIRQNLVGLPGAELSGIREVLSHPEGLKQCSRFLQSRHWEQTACRNTAVAAKQVAQSGDAAKAAVASAWAAKLYGLSVLAPDIMDSADNRTSFVVIAGQPEYDQHSGLISVTFSTRHRSGALCEALMPFMAENLNLTRIESRPAAADKYRFFAEIEGNILDKTVLDTLGQAAAASEYFEVLGCYTCVEWEETQ